MRKKQNIICKYCGDVFSVVRNDAERCPECRKKWFQEWRKRPETVERRISIYRQMRLTAYAGYGGKCQCCGENKFEFLAIDHVNGGGRKERETMSTAQIARKVIKNNFPPEYRVLCHNCNMALGFFGYCPHKN